MTISNPLLPTWLLEAARTDAENLVKHYPEDISLRPLRYDPSTYVVDIAHNPYTDALIVIRHYLKLASDIYFSQHVGAKNIDLFMMTPSVSSPMGPGSDSEAVPITFGELETFLVDSSQFGFEPLILQNLEKVYCYLPSMRGEDPDARHLNQFFHCELEMRGTLEELRPIVEGYVRALAEVMLALIPLVERMSAIPEQSVNALRKLLSDEPFNSITFDQAYEELTQDDNSIEFIQTTSDGRDIRAAGEIRSVETHGGGRPLWISQYDRDRVPFYQKPHPENRNTVVNADLIFPPLARGAFGGEIVGAGQRQDTAEEMYESLKRQGLSAEPYEWYINVRQLDAYQTTSGFGLGIERFIAWALAYENIRDVILYPRLKNIKTLP